MAIALAAISARRPWSWRFGLTRAAPQARVEERVRAISKSHNHGALARRARAADDPAPLALPVWRPTLPRLFNLPTDTCQGTPCPKAIAVTIYDAVALPWRGLAVHPMFGVSSRGLMGPSAFYVARTPSGTSALPCFFADSSNRSASARLGRRGGTAFPPAPANGDITSGGDVLETPADGPATVENAGDAPAIGRATTQFLLRSPGGDTQRGVRSSPRRSTARRTWSATLPRCFIWIVGSRSC
jgi:hypothetical protein